MFCRVDDEEENYYVLSYSAAIEHGCACPQLDWGSLPVQLIFHGIGSVLVRQGNSYSKKLPEKFCLESELNLFKRL